MPLVAVLVGLLNRRAVPAMATTASERRFRLLLDHATDAIEIIDPETGRLLDVNEKACLAHGYTREKYFALNVPDIDPTMTPGGLERSMRASEARFRTLVDEAIPV